MITLTHSHTQETIQIDANDPKLNKYIAFGWVQS